MVVTALIIGAGLWIHGWIMNCQPYETTVNISTEFEQVAAGQGVRVVEVADYTQDTTWFGNGKSYVRANDAGTLVAFAKENNATVLSCTLNIGAWAGVKRCYGFTTNYTSYEFVQRYYPEDKNVIGYDVAGIAKWPTVVFHTSVFSVIALHVIAIIILFAFWVIFAFEHYW